MLKLMSPLTPRSFWLVKPSVGLSTKAVFGALQLADLPTRDPSNALEGWKFGKPQLFNDLETPAFQIMPQLGLLKTELMFSGFQHVSLTGSGTAFICMGGPAAEPPFVPGLSLYPANFLNRVKDKWY